jgi:hypothetical protein
MDGILLIAISVAYLQKMLWQDRLPVQQWSMKQVCQQLCTLMTCIGCNLDTMHAGGNKGCFCFPPNL